MIRAIYVVILSFSQEENEYWYSQMPKGLLLKHLIYAFFDKCESNQVPTAREREEFSKSFCPYISETPKYWKDILTYMYMGMHVTLLVFFPGTFGRLSLRYNSVLSKKVSLSESVSPN